LTACPCTVTMWMLEQFADPLGDGAVEAGEKVEKILAKRGRKGLTN
jgi:hypothetical protein